MHVFLGEERNNFKNTDVVQHRIETDALAIKKALYTIPLARKQEVDN
jgi:hypothetical protein